MRFITCCPLLFCALASLVNTHFFKINESFFVLWLYVSCIVLHLQQKQQLKTTIMKIQAKDLEIGMTVTSGYCELTIEEIINGVQKNGKETITVVGMAKRRHTGSKKFRMMQSELLFKALTFVNAH